MRNIAELAAGKFAAGSPIAVTAQLGRTDQNIYQLDVFCIGEDGRLWEFWEQNDTGWSSLVVPVPRVAPAAPLTASTNGLNVISLTTTGLGDASFTFTLAAPGGSWTSASSFWGVPTGAWLDVTNGVVLVDRSGTLIASAFQHDFLWAPGTITSAGFAPPGAPVAVGQRVLGTDPQAGLFNVFCVGNDGRLHAFSIDDKNAWHEMLLPGDVTLAPGSFVAVGYQTAQMQLGLEKVDYGNSQLDVFAIDGTGQLHIWYSAQGADWQHVTMPMGAGLPPGAPIGIGYQSWDEADVSGMWPFPRQLDVFVVDADGRLRIFYNYESRGFEAGILPQDVPLPPGAHIATANQQVDGQREFHQLDVFVVDALGRIQVFWESDEGNWTRGVMPGS